MINNKFLPLFCFCFFMPACVDVNQMPKQRPVKNSSILLLHIKGVILGETAEIFGKNIRKYASQNKIKGVLVRVDSPGGTVAASQEINSAISEVKKLYKKPVYVSGGDVVASGGVYAVTSADKIFVNEGTLFGSIGVIASFQNLSELVRWAKMEIYNIKSGEFKDSGDPFRKMTLRERELFENLLENAHEQFKNAIVEGRKLDPKQVEAFSDGRIFSGQSALDYGLVDAVGTFNQTIREIGEKTGLGSDPDLFDPEARTPYEKFFEKFSAKNEFFMNLFSRWNYIDALSGKPLYILPSHISL